MERLRRLGGTVLTHAQNRLDLVAVKLQEERIGLVDALLLMAGVVALAFVTLATAGFALDVVVWGELGANRLWAMSGLGLVCTLLTYWWLRERLKRCLMLAGTLAKLKMDRECLDNTK